MAVFEAKQQTENLSEYVFVNNNNETKLKTSINTEISEIGKFFANKNVFITGGTGFLGTVLIESLLSSHPDIGRIYVLVRGKKRYDPNERINRLLQKPVSLYAFFYFKICSNILFFKL